MKRSDIPSDNAAVAALPDHLLQFAVNQRYHHYTAIDHAAWRFIMRQNAFFLREYAHKLYFQGLLSTGISFDRIPRIEEMNQILSKIGWGAVAVDGFIPPAAFMEFQAYRVLVIACDMRQIQHIEYTPAPDIVHEAAGHAPIIVDREYADYLQRFGEVGAKAMSSRKDFELYEAIRHLSILKELPTTSATEIQEAQDIVVSRQAGLGTPSEMALLSRLHWWTVEYGLIGSLEHPKIYGAGLLSSIGESVTCLEEDVKKLPYAAEAQNYPFDITTRQPQLFVTKDFEQLSAVLEEFAATMAFRTGGIGGLAKAIECNNVATCEYSSGLQVSGVFTEVLTGERGEAIYLQAKGGCALAICNKELPSHGRKYHVDGFGSPIGRWKQCGQAPEILTDAQLKGLGLCVNNKGVVDFDSGIQVEGKLEAVRRQNGRLIVLSFSDCRVHYHDRILFHPDWGRYDMAVGETIVSVYNGAADKTAFHDIALTPRARTIKVPPSEKSKKLESLYQQVHDVRNNGSGYGNLEAIWESQQAEYPDDWLLSLEIFEIATPKPVLVQLARKTERFLAQKVREEKESATLIGWGFRLVEYYKDGMQPDNLGAASGNLAA